MAEKLTWSRECISIINERTSEMRDIIIEKILREIPYLVGRVYDRKELNNISPNEVVDKIIWDLSLLKEKDDFKSLNEEYESIRKRKITLEKYISERSADILASLDTKETTSIYLRPLLGMRLTYFIADYASQNINPSKEEIEKCNLSDLIKFCVENDSWESDIKRYPWFWPSTVDKIKKVFEQYNINI